MFARRKGLRYYTSNCTSAPELMAALDGRASTADLCCCMLARALFCRSVDGTADHAMRTEWGRIDATADRLNAVRAGGRR
jgi:hypothetical protein